MNVIYIYIYGKLHVYIYILCIYIYTYYLDPQLNPCITDIRNLEGLGLKAYTAENLRMIPV